jgi:uncharacterized membrane protein
MKRRSRRCLCNQNFAIEMRQNPAGAETWFSRSVPLRNAIVLYLSAALVFLPLDALWLGLVARNFYKAEIGPLLLERPNWGVALLFYLLYLAGLVIFAVMPALATGSWRTALLYGALFGFFAYATYDLTNLATLRGFTWRVALVDLAWGTAASAATAALGFLIARYWLKLA